MDDACDLLKRDIDPAEYQEIRDLWKAHSIAEDRRDIAGLLATLTEDCVCEEADVTGTHRSDWLGYRASGGRVAFKVVIFFPWDPVRRKFAGERVFALRGLRDETLKALGGIDERTNGQR